MFVLSPSVLDASLTPFGLKYVGASVGVCHTGGRSGHTQDLFVLLSTALYEASSRVWVWVRVCGRETGHVYRICSVRTLVLLILRLKNHTKISVCFSLSSSAIFAHPVEVRVHQSDVVVGDDAVPQGGQTFLHPLDDNRVGQGVTEVLQLLVCRCVGNEQPSLVTCRQHVLPRDDNVGNGSRGGGKFYCFMMLLHQII